MLKNRMIYLLVIGLVLGLTMGSFTPTKAFIFDAVAEWETVMEYEGSTYSVMNQTLTVQGETTTRWFARIDYQTFSSINGFISSKVPKESLMTLFGFLVKSTGVIWGYWINLKTVSEISSFNLNAEIFGLLDISNPSVFNFAIKGPFLFAVVSTTTTVADELYGVWAYITPTEDCAFYYDNTTGLLLKSFYYTTLNDKTVKVVTERTNYILPTSGAPGLLPTNFFTVDVLVISASVIGFIILGRRKQKRSNG
ncbi:MAG: hypothetical protein ACFFBD_19335 [Candidatus Hodarchaeota archaeon]